MMNSNCDSALFEAMDYNGAIMEYKKAEQEFEKDTINLLETLKRLCFMKRPVINMRIQ